MRKGHPGITIDEVNVRWGQVGVPDFSQLCAKYNPRTYTVTKAFAYYF